MIDETEISQHHDARQFDAKFLRRIGFAAEATGEIAIEPMLGAAGMRLSDILCSDVICQANGKRSWNMMVSCDLTACHSRTERFQSDEVALSVR